ncbi:MAG: ferredoxin [Acidobacteria bacterium]|nr:MAG: ferredoxin [Acidobacteriota bacterium]
MADPNDRVPENTPGAYYVDTNCIDCDVCRDTAPSNFTRADRGGYSFVFITRADSGGYSFVFKQPESDAETALCEEALLCCPVEAIGNDG